MRIRLHVNRREMAKGTGGKVWTLHTSKGCFQAKSVDIHVPCETEYRPEFHHNPKIFLRMEGKLNHLGGYRYEIV